MSREIDRKIAEMMGIEVHYDNTSDFLFVVDKHGHKWALGRYSFDIANAWEVVEWMRGKGWWFELRDFLEDNSGKRTMWAEFYRPIDEDENHEGCSDGQCPAEAICLAALDAMQQPTA